MSADWDLIQLTAPHTDPDRQGCGVVFARGGFSDDPKDILACGQRTGFGFGLKLPKRTSHHWNDGLRPKDAQERPTSGYINYRWPITQETLTNEKDAILGEIITAWYIKSGTLHQVTKISAFSATDANPVEVPYRHGGPIRLGCSCSAYLSLKDPKFRTPCGYTFACLEPGRNNQIMQVRHDTGTQLAMRWFIDGKPQRMELKDARRSLDSVDVGSDGVIQIGEKPVIVIHMVSLRATSFEPDSLPRVPTVYEVERELGLVPQSGCWSRLWRAFEWSSVALFPTKDFMYQKMDVGESDPEAVDPDRHRLKVDIVARTTEYLLTVVTLPVGTNDADEDFEKSPIALLSNMFASMAVDLQSLL